SHRAHTHCRLMVSQPRMTSTRAMLSLRTWSQARPQITTRDRSSLPSARLANCQPLDPPLQAAGSYGKHTGSPCSGRYCTLTEPGVTAELVLGTENSQPRAAPLTLPSALASPAAKSFEVVMSK